jgi:hypothetical protein
MEYHPAMIAAAGQDAPNLTRIHVDADTEQQQD